MEILDFLYSNSRSLETARAAMSAALRDLRAAQADESLAGHARLVYSEATAMPNGDLLVIDVSILPDGFAVEASLSEEDGTHLAYECHVNTDDLTIAWGIQ